ncbi:hypothetical protein RAS1_39280 [Phycisphaerae bacterium RAS1]|nr:hypothetical protein RAS1_39280 [Phycisphaerae bacterium RAS1]
MRGLQLVRIGCLAEASDLLDSALRILEETNSPDELGVNTTRERTLRARAAAR